MVKKIIFFVLWLILFSFSWANNYILYYGKGCPHCAKVELFMEKNNINWIVKKEVWFDKKNAKEFQSILESFKIERGWVPFLYIETETGSFYKMWDSPIISYLAKNKLDLKPVKSHILKNDEKKTTWKFLLVLIPAALSDSINPCAFAVILILLGSIFMLYKDRKKVLLAGLTFSLSIFLSYLAMWIWLYKALASVENTLYLKLWVWILWILVGLANLKDVFWYGKWFVMEVPFSWRPKLKKLLAKATSPLGAFFVGIFVSLFLLPCTSGPYFTILWYLSSESKTITSLWYIYLIIYNLIFILPMLIITLLVTYNTAYVEKLQKIKDDKNWLIHLIVGLLMLSLWIYVIYDSWIFL